MAKKTTKKKTPKLRFDQKLVLNQWMLAQFGLTDIESLSENLKSLEYEGLDANNVHHFHQQIKVLCPNSLISNDDLLRYDENIVKHTLRIEHRRKMGLKWKYFQYLSLLFTEVYLDRFFRDPEKLLEDLNAQVGKFNSDKTDSQKLPLYVADDLTKVAFWNATGSGKTLLMHVHIGQYLHYQRTLGAQREVDRIILLTPKEGLSKQHLAEFRLSGIDAEIFSKDTRQNLFSGKTIEIIDINKLADDMGDKTVAVDAFEGKNLVLVDEGHRGAASGKDGAWMIYRDKLCESGFSFEYSATFGQALKSGTALEAIYAKNILFDYSYKYFYKDGYGKDYRILNLADDSDEDRRRLYLTACLVTFYQQQKLFAERTTEFRTFLLEKPLWVFVGDSVNAVRSEKKKQVSDVVDIVMVLSQFVRDKSQSIELLGRLISGSPGLLDSKNREIFASAFSFLVSQKLNSDQLYDDILQTVFNAPTQAKLHVEQLKGTDGEIALRIGDNDPFGLIDVGDASKLCKLCENFPDFFDVTDKEFSGSYFHSLNEDDSPINVLIGSRKFNEGWNSWRVSTMGLMNVGKSKGALIIQLFGRGVRLKGKGFTLKRSSCLDLQNRPDFIGLIETLNIFGVKASYMQQFRDYLEEEGLPGNEEREPFALPVINNLGGKELTTIRLKDGVDFKKQAPKPTLDVPPEKILKHPINLNWYPKIQARQSSGVGQLDDVSDRHEAKFEDKHLAFMNLNNIWFELQRFKNERAWYNLNLPKEAIEPLLRNEDWYTLAIPKEEMEFNSFEKVRRWEEIAVAMLKKYVDRYYKYRKSEWESGHLEYQTLDPNDPNFIEEYQLLIDQSKTEIIQALNGVREELESGKFTGWSLGNLFAFEFGQHLYQPLLYIKSEYVDVSPATLNKGERDFVLDLRKFYEQTPEFFEDKEMYLLRNRSRGRGIGFFEAGNFYPDFIVWILTNDKQYVTFVDPKGIRNMEGPNDPKIRFYKDIKTLENDLGDPDVILNSFIISNTPYQKIKWWGLEKPALKTSHVLFQKDDTSTYIHELLSVASSEKQVEAVNN